MHSGPKEVKQNNTRIVHGVACRGMGIKRAHSGGRVPPLLRTCSFNPLLVLTRRYPQHPPNSPMSESLQRMSSNSEGSDRYRRNVVLCVIAGVLTWMLLLVCYCCYLPRSYSESVSFQSDLLTPTGWSILVSICKP